jgi:hyaluronan synthase
VFIFILQVRRLAADQTEIYLFAVFSALVWALWLIKVVLSRRYRPWTAPHHETTTVVVPVVDEPLPLFRDVLRRVVEQRPDEVVVVINGARNPGLEAVCEEFAPLLRWTHTPVPGKRGAVRIGVEQARGDVVVLVDSDTVWTTGTLSELVKPFADPRVGGVTTRQRILDPARSWITRWADWLENSRSLYAMPAQSVLGTVGCLPGRTIAFRRHVLDRAMPEFLAGRFLGVFLEVSDDRTLTNLTLKQGYRTAYQHTSLVYTDAPLRLGKLFRQQLRWARGSQYNTLRMLPWMLRHAPVLALFFTADILLPFLLLGTIAGWVYRSASGTGVNLYEAMLESYGAQRGWYSVIALMLASSVLSMAIRQIRHLQEVPGDALRLPVFIVVSTLFLMPVRLLGFLRMAHVAGWGTRAGAYSGGGAVGDRGTGPGDAGGPAGEGRRLPVAAGAVAARVATVPADEAPAHGATATALAAPADTLVRAASRAPAAPPTPLRVRDRARTATAASRRRPNPLAAVPYLLAAVLLVSEALLYV